MQEYRNNLKQHIKVALQNTLPFLSFYRLMEEMYYMLTLDLRRLYCITYLYYLFLWLCGLCG